MISYDTMVKEYGYDPDEKLDEPTDEEIDAIEDEAGAYWDGIWAERDALRDDDPEDHLDDGIYYKPDPDADELPF